MGQWEDTVGMSIAQQSLGSYATFTSDMMEVVKLLSPVFVAEEKREGRAIHSSVWFFMMRSMCDWVSSWWDAVAQQ